MSLSNGSLLLIVSLVGFERFAPNRSFFSDSLVLFSEIFLVRFKRIAGSLVLFERRAPLFLRFSGPFRTVCSSFSDSLDTFECFVRLSHFSSGSLLFLRRHIRAFRPLSQFVSSLLERLCSLSDFLVLV